MSALYGVVAPLADATLRASLDGQSQALAHRGRNAVGAWIDENAGIGIGGRVFATTPEALHEHLPLVSRDQRFVITADARLDNRDDLVRQLTIDDPAQTPDSALILIAFQRWGASCVDRLIGDFAFAIWDRQDRRLFCARDRFGVKPFYYAAHSRRFVFASEAKGVLAIAEVPRDLDWQEITRLLLPTVANADTTLYSAIRRLPPAHTLTLTSEGGVRIERYWQLDPQPLSGRSDDAYVEEFRAHFTEAVRTRMRTHLPVASAISGGLDSTAVSMVARRLTNAAQWRTYSAIFPDVPESDEQRFIALAHAEGGYDGRFFRADSISPLRKHDDLLHAFDRFSLVGNYYLTWRMFEEAHANGDRVFLDGIDGDTVVSHGVGQFADLTLARDWATFKREATALDQRGGLYQAGGFTGGLVHRHVFPLLIDLARAGAIGDLWRTLGEVRDAFNLSRARLLRQIILPGLLPRREPQQHLPVNELIARASIDPHALLDQSAIDRLTERAGHVRAVTSPLASYSLEHLDHGSAAVGIDLRHPFFDQRLIEFTTALPNAQKLRDGWTRSIMRRAMVGILPDALVWRTVKSNFDRTLRHVLRTYEGDRLRALAEGQTTLHPLLNADLIRADARGILAGGGGRTTTLFIALSFDRWMMLKSGG